MQLAILLSGSHPMRVRGLKFSFPQNQYTRHRVAPHAGAWIEILRQDLLQLALDLVAPHAGAWIEMIGSGQSSLSAKVAPHAGAWIEIVPPGYCNILRMVAPHAGAWIEIASRIRAA